MSNRSIMEFNHDYWDRIHNEPVRFKSLILRWLSSCDEEAKDELTGFGVTIHGWQHHSSKPWADVIADGKKPK